MAKLCYYINMPRSKNFIKKKCKDCLKEFKIFLNESKEIRRKRKQCRACSRKNYNKGQFKKINKKPFSRDAEYVKIHKYIKKEKGTPSFCEVCGTNDESKRYEWSNKDHKYSLNLSDYVRMCSYCHWHYDNENNLRGKRVE